MVALSAVHCAPEGTESFVDQPSETPGPEVTATPLPPLTVSAPTIRFSPNSVLALTVQFTTSAPATATVALTDAQGRGVRAEDPVPGTDHAVLVIGLHASTLYDLAISAQTPDGRSSSTTGAPVGTDALPDNIPVGEVTIYDPERVEPGWTLTNVSNRDLDWPAAAVMYDMTGQPVWYYVDGTAEDTRGDMDVRLLDGSHILMGASGANIDPVIVDLAGNVVWQGPEQPGSTQGQAHHHYQRLANGNFVTLVHETQDDVGGDKILEITPEHAVVWSWNVFDWLDPGDASSDWTHANSVTVDLDADVVYLSCRNLNTIFKLDRADGHIIWRLGNGGDFATDPEADVPWFLHQHDPEILPNGNILLYDNGYTRRTVSRVVEYALDEEAWTARIVWEYPGSDVDDVWYTRIWGDADRLSNGNTLVTAGTRDEGSDQRSRIFEVTPDRTRVWEMWFPSEEEFTVGIYRAERIAPPGIEVLGQD